MEKKAKSKGMSLEDMKRAAQNNKDHIEAQRRVAEKARQDAERKAAEQERKIAPLKEIIVRLSAAKEKIERNEQIDAFSTRILKLAVILKIHEGREIIDKATQTLVELSECMRYVPGANCGKFNDSLTAVKKQIQELYAQCDELSLNFEDVSGDTANLVNCIEFVCRQVKDTLDGKSDFGYMLAQKSENDIVAQYSKKADELTKAFDEKTKIYDTTPTEYDDNIGTLYDAFSCCLDAAIDALNRRTADELGNDKLELNKEVADISQKYDYVKKASALIEDIYVQYIKAMEYRDDRSALFGMYLPSDKNSSVSKLIESANCYDGKIREMCEKFVAVSTDEKAEKGIKPMYDLLLKEYIWLKDLSDKIEAYYKQCMIEANNVINGDIVKIRQAFARVKPTVPEYVSDILYAPVPLRRFAFDVKSGTKVYAEKHLTVLAFSSVISALKNNNAKIRIVKAFSTETFVKLGLISAESQAVLIIDDGYDMSATLKAWGMSFDWNDCFDAEDIQNGKLYFSDSAKKTFNKIVK